ncbi:hypothetical protein QNM99_08195 [Pseudomonas sp. PCH446]
MTAGDKEGTIPFTDGIWRQPKARPSIPGVVIYAGVDGSFSAWDPARNYWSDQQADAEEKIRAFNFSPDEVWKGAVSEKGTNICNGLIHDWVRWQQTSGDSPFNELVTALDALSPSGIEKLSPGSPCHIGALDETEYPTLRMPYGWMCHWCMPQQGCVVLPLWPICWFGLGTGTNERANSGK